MARIRTIKPEFFTHHDLYQLEYEACIPIRVAFAGLWTQADREGRFKWVPQQLKLGCLPYDDVDFSRVLDALCTRGFIKKYHVEGVDYGWIPSFCSNQVVNNREMASLLPELNENNTLTCEPRVDDALTTRAGKDQGEGKGREGKGKEGKERESSENDASNTAKKFTFEDSHKAIAEQMSESALKRYPTQKINIDEWADAIRKLMEIDGHSKEWILWLWSWIQNHDDGGFSWADQIRSPMKLRKVKDGVKYFDKLKSIAQRQHQNNSQNKMQEAIEERNKELGIGGDGDQGEGRTFDAEL